MPLLDKTGLIVPANAPQPVAFEALDNVASNAAVGVIVEPDVDRQALAARFDRLDLIVITVSGMGDGRVFSLSQSLREAGFAGRIRACGPLIPDQFGYALACGIDEIEISEAQLARQPVEQWLAASTGITRTYTRPESIFALRQEKRGAA